MPEQRRDAAHIIVLRRQAVQDHMVRNLHRLGGVTEKEPEELLLFRRLRTPYRS